MAKKKTQEIFIPKPIGEVTTSNYLDIANYVNSSRHMCDILDGCKPSYRRLIWAGFQFPKGKLIPTTKLIAEVSNYHPHSTSGIEGTNAVLVNSGVFTGEGSFGFTSITGEYNPPAATRYTKNRVSDLYHDIMGDALKYVEMVESPVEALEPRYLPLPLPLCLKYDTKIRLLDGRDLTIKEIVEEFKSGKENFVLSCSPEGRFTVSKIIWGDKTKITNKYVRLELDNGEVVESTLDHRFMMRDGSYKEAKDLVPGDSMMPGKISHDKDGRAMITSNYDFSTEFIYKLSSSYNIHNGVYSNELKTETGEPYCVHHVDKNKSNDNPTNLVRISRSEHQRIHKQDKLDALHKLQSTPEYKQREKESWDDPNRNYTVGNKTGLTRREAQREWSKSSWEKRTEEQKQKAREILQKRNSDPEFIQKVKDSWTPERRAAAAERRAEMNQDPEFIEKVKEGWKNHKNSEERRKNASELLKKRNADPEFQKQVHEIRVKNGSYQKISEKAKQRREERNKEFRTTQPSEVLYKGRKWYIEMYKRYLKDGLSKEEAFQKMKGENFSKWFSDDNEFWEFEKIYNHNIVKIEIIEGNENIDFYDITVDSCYHNFLLSSGIVAHNCLFLSQQISGLGFSVSTLYPNFSPVSLYNAYIHNDPSLLEPRVDLELDKGKSELLGLWRYGKGKVTYSYHTQRVSDPSTKREGVLIYGDTSIFTPRLTKIRKLMEDGKAYMEDMTDEGGPKLFIGRVPGARGITVDDIWKITETIKSGTLSCVLNITNGTMTYRIPLYDWLDYTIKNYHNLISFSNQDKIRRTEFEIQVQEAIPVVTDYILNRNPKATDKELVANLGLSIEVIQEVLKKPISNLRKTKDTSDKIKALKAKLKSLKAFDPVVFTEDIIGKL